MLQAASAALATAELRGHSGSGHLRYLSELAAHLRLREMQQAIRAGDSSGYENEKVRRHRR